MCCEQLLLALCVCIHTYICTLVCPYVLVHHTESAAEGLTMGYPPYPSQEFGSQTSIAAPPGHTFGVHIHLVEGVRLAVRDRGGGCGSRWVWQ